MVLKYLIEYYFTKYFKITWGNENDTLILKKFRYNYN